MKREAVERKCRVCGCTDGRDRPGSLRRWVLHTKDTLTRRLRAKDFMWGAVIVGAMWAIFTLVSLLAP